MNTLNLNPKIRNAAITAIVLSLISVGNALIDVYPDQAWTPILALVLTVLVGWATKADGWTNAPTPAAN